MGTKNDVLIVEYFFNVESLRHFSCFCIHFGIRFGSTNRTSNIKLENVPMDSGT